MLDGYFGMLANNIYNKARVKNSEILELLIYSAYIEEQSQLDEYEQSTFREVITYYYQEGQKEVNKTKKPSMIPEIILATIMSMPNAKGYIWKDYKDGIIKYNAEQIYRQATIDLQQQKELDITNDIYQNIIKRQNNSRLNINGDKISGDVDLTLIGMNNRAKMEGIYSFDENAEVEFIAVEDKATTKMCHSLNGQKFKVHDWNEFKRYSKANDSIVKYRCYGLVTGLNLPPIDDGFHWCRSTIRYVKTVEKQKEKYYNDLEYPSYIRLNVDKGYKPESEIDKIVNAITKIPPNVRDLVEDTQYEIFSLGKVYRNNEVVKNSFYDRNENKIYILDGQDLTEGEVIHEIGHAVETKLGILNNNDYIRIRSYGLENYNKSSIKSNEELGADCIKNSKFISDLQGKVYKRDLNGNYRTYSNDSLNLNCLGDYFSEGFREYIENKENLLKNDKELYNYIRGVINGL